MGRLGSDVVQVGHTFQINVEITHYSISRVALALRLVGENSKQHHL